MTTSEPARSWRVAIETNYLVSRYCWNGGLEELIETTIIPERADWAKAVHEHFDELETPVFLDRLSHAYAILGTIKIDQPYQEHQIRGAMSTIAWLPDYLVLRVLFWQDRLAKPTGDRLSSLAHQFEAQSINQLTIELPMLCQCVYQVDESLSGVYNHDDVLVWSNKDRPAPFLKIGALYSAFEPFTTVLHVVDPGSPQKYVHYSAKPPTIQLLRPSPEIDAAIQCLATRHIARNLRFDAELVVKGTRSSKLPNGAKTISIGFWHLLASLYPGYHDPFATLGGVIDGANNEISQMYGLVRAFNTLYPVYDLELEPQSGTLIVTRVGSGGILAAKDSDDVRKLSFANYYRRSALATRDYYKPKFAELVEELKAYLSYLQTASTARNEQRTAILNRLVLILTFVSAGLALLQVFGATEGWSIYWLLLTGLLMICLVIGAVYYANKRVSKEAAQSRSSDAQQDSMQR